MPSPEVVARMLWACNERFKNLVDSGCAEDVALDRTWDAYVCAFDGADVHCYDQRDRLFEGKLRTIREKGFTNA